MKHFTFLGLMALVSCSTPPTKFDIQNDLVLDHMAKGKKVIGQDFDSKFNQDGLIGGEYIAIASITDKINKNDKQMLTLAEADARSRLLNSAPTEFKKVIQNVISTSTGDNGSVDNIGITVTEVKALTGLTSSFNDVQCVKYSIPNSDMGYDYSKECRVIVRVPAPELMKAYSYTMDKKYGVKEQSAIQELLKKQLSDKLLDQPPVASASTASIQ